MAEFGKTRPLQNTDYHLAWKKIQKQLVTIKFIDKHFQESLLLLMEIFCFNYLYAVTLKETRGPEKWQQSLWTIPYVRLMNKC